LQQIVEGMQVRNVVGLAVAIYSQTEQTDKTLPSNLDPTTEPSREPASNRQTTNPGSNLPGTTPPARGTASPAAIQPTAPPKGLVATGIIRLVDVQGATASGGPAPNATDSAPIEQPAQNVPPTGANPIR
jgi:hypothetical protein